jgi:hypothetical protein
MTALGGRVEPPTCGRIVRSLHLVHAHLCGRVGSARLADLEERVACEPLAAVRVRLAVRAAADPPTPRSAVGRHTDRSVRMRRSVVAAPGRQSARG